MIDMASAGQAQDLPLIFDFRGQAPDLSLHFVPGLHIIELAFQQIKIGIVLWQDRAVSAYD